MQMCDECESLRKQLEDLRSKWNSAEATYSRSIFLTEQKFGGYSYSIGPSGCEVKQWGKKII